MLWRCYASLRNACEIDVGWLCRPAKGITRVRDTVAAVKRELVKSANLFAQFHIMNHEKTGQWPEWYQQRHDAALSQAIFWEREWAERVDPFVGFPPEMSGEDKCDLFLGQILAAVGKTDELEALQQEKGWSREDMEGMLAGVEGKKQEVVVPGQSQKKQAASHRLYDKLQKLLQVILIPSCNQKGFNAY